jgi:pimeloyl-ACP methyl ester carboxylesterase
MVPNHYVLLDALPLTANGKVDRRSLPDHRTVHGSQTSPAPRDAAELGVQACWEDVLDREGIGVRDDLFTIGGSSRTVLRLVEEIRARLGVEVAPDRLFTAPTIEQLCAAESGIEAAVGGRIQRLRRGRADRAPIVLLPDVTGGAARYRPLADVLDGGFPVLALEAVGRAPNERPLERISDMAASCLLQLRELRTPEPVVLLGWGIGARVAAALAGLMDRNGAAPRLVIAVHPDGTEPGAGSAAARYAAASGLNSPGALDDQAATAALLRQEKRRSQLPPSADPERMRRLLAVFTAAETAEREAVAPGPVPADLLHLHGAAPAGPVAPNWVSATGRTRSVRLPLRLRAIPAGAELLAVGETVDRVLNGAPC